MRTDIAELLIDIESELRQLDLWDTLTPSSEALASDQPFCVDTLTLPQWLQFIFLPTLYQLLETDGVLPQRCGIAPMAEEYFRAGNSPSSALERALSAIDLLLSADEGDDN
ncbi:MAG: YqcC family protein [Halioglobus sp.]